MCCIHFLQKNEPLQARVGKHACVQESPFFAFLCNKSHIFLLTEKELHGQYDPGDSGMGPSTSTDMKGTTYSEVSYYLMHYVATPANRFLLQLH